VVEKEFDMVEKRTSETISISSAFQFTVELHGGRLKIVNPCGVSTCLQIPVRFQFVFQETSTQAEVSFCAPGMGASIG
jgi:hypothetical protein